MNDDRSAYISFLCVGLIFRNLDRRQRRHLARVSCIPFYCIVAIVIGIAICHYRLMHCHDCALSNSPNVYTRVFESTLPKLNGFERMAIAHEDEEK